MQLCFQFMKKSVDAYILIIVLFWLKMSILLFNNECNDDEWVKRVNFSE